MSRKLLAALAAAVALSGASVAHARPFNVDDLLHQQSLGAVAFDPSGRWVVFEERGAYDAAPRYDYDQANSQTLSRLKVFDLAREGPVRPLLAADPGPGVTMGPFSPSGRYLAVYRLADRRWRLGIVTLATGEARWLEIDPRDGARGRALQWLSDDTLLVLHQTDHRPPQAIRLGFVMADRLPQYWEAAATGAGSHTAFGSGRYLAVRPRAAPAQLLAVDAKTGTPQTLATGDFIDLEVSPDNRRVALLTAGPDVQPRGDRPVRGPAGLETEATRLSILDLQTGAIQTPCAACDMLPQLFT
ncbi:MAG: S9 family peptidase, partial [Phenylobacterium sp.]